MSTPVIALEGVTKRYDTGSAAVDALRGIDLEIPAGEFAAIMGPSGSGKTTLLEILGCLSRPSSGSYRFCGELVDLVPPNHLAQLRGERIGFVFQAFNLLPRLSTLENVELPLIYRRVPRRVRHRVALEALRQVGLEHRAGHRPSELSGGERQRTAIARALVNDPAVLLADEPTGNLDSETGQTVLDVLRKLHAEGRTVVIVTHDPSITSQAERQVHIRDGKVERDHRIV